jgi:hypothetical protein
MKSKNFTDLPGISGVPIVASDPVIYTVTATGRRGHDTATVVITVGVGTTNLAFGKPATQSSNYYNEWT